MASIIRNLINKFYASDPGHIITLLGLDSSGKTTLLYWLKLHEIVTTIPSIGFNVETVDVTSTSGKHLRLTAWDIGTACGIHYLYGLVNVYASNAEAVIWMVDTCDKERLSESVETLTRVLSDLDKNKPILILANKVDKPEAMSIDTIRLAFSKATSGRIAAIFKTTLTGNQNTGLPEAFDWLITAMEIAKSPNFSQSRVQALNQSSIGKGTSEKTGSIPNPRSPSELAHKLETWLNRIEDDLAPEEFLEKFRSFSLPAWDHYTHIRIAYLLLTKHGRQAGKDLIFKGLESYITTSPQTKGRSFHFTMTYFWIQIVHFGIRNTPPPLFPPPTEDKSSNEKPKEFDEFARFLLVNPHVVDGNLWADYYTKDVIMSTQAKAQMVLPDKKPLPSLVIRDAITTLGQKS